MPTAAQEAARLVSWADQHLPGQACDLGALIRLLQPFAAEAWSVPDPGNMESAAPARDEAKAATPSVPGSTPEASGVAASRQEAQAWIACARQWFDMHEPSSPVGVLLRQAERLVGKRYAEVAAAIPMDLLLRWDAPTEDER